MWILCSVWKMIFPSIRRSFQRLHKVYLNGISYQINIILLNRRDKICDFSWYRRNSRKGGPRIECLWYRFLNVHIPNSLQFGPFFQFSITFNNSCSPFYFPYPSIFATCYPFPDIFTSFQFPPNRATSPFYPSVRSSSPTYFTSILKLFIIQPMV